MKVEKMAEVKVEKMAEGSVRVTGTESVPCSATVAEPKLAKASDDMYHEPRCRRKAVFLQQCSHSRLYLRKIH